MDRTESLIEQAASRVRELEHDAIAVLVFGSFARDRAGDGSDLDLRVLTGGEPRDRNYRMWFQERPDAPPLHVSAGVEHLDAWLERRASPEWWTFGFPAHQVLRYAWATDEARSRLGADPSYDIAAGEPELEDFVEYVGKVQRYAARGDLLGARLFAQGVGLLAPRLLRGADEDVVVYDRREALDAALSLRGVPNHYRADLPVVLGLVMADDNAVVESVLRLGRELLVFLRERNPNIDPQPDIARYLADGTLERHLGFLDT
jgi:predicted nucleotidyltransferase